MIVKCHFALILSIFTSTVTLVAEDLQITDYLGLIRAQRSVPSKATVAITVRHSDSADPLDTAVPLLTQRTGIALDIESVPGAKDEFLFLNVTPGVWRIRLRNKGLLLDSVSIKDPG